MLSGSHLVMIGMAAMVLALVVCKVVESITKQKQSTKDVREPPTADP